MSDPAEEDGEGFVRVFQLPKVDKEKFKIKCEKSQEIQLKFAPNGSAVIVWSQSFVDVICCWSRAMKSLVYSCVTAKKP